MKPFWIHRVTLYFGFRGGGIPAYLMTWTPSPDLWFVDCKLSIVFIGWKAFLFYGVHPQFFLWTILSLIDKKNPLPNVKKSNRNWHWRFVFILPHFVQLIIWRKYMLNFISQVALITLTSLWPQVVTMSGSYHNGLFHTN